MLIDDASTQVKALVEALVDMLDRGVVVTEGQVVIIHFKGRLASREEVFWEMAVISDHN
jgi:hypothetical protein